MSIPGEGSNLLKFRRPLTSGPRGSRSPLALFHSPLGDKFRPGCVVGRDLRVAGSSWAVGGGVERAVLLSLLEQWGSIHRA
eukprot:scaffold10659_cov38-Phaeocystis_antarctica.AAC.1